MRCDRKLRRAVCALVMAGFALTAVDAGWALINPGFTPVHLTQQSKLILLLKIGPAGPKGKITVQVIKCLKGQAPKAPLKIDIGEMRKVVAEAFMSKVKYNGAGPVMLFSGEYKEEGRGGDAGGVEPVAAGREKAEGMLHVMDRWFSMRKDKGGVWYPQEIDTDMEATWAGSTDMLLGVTKYILTDGDPVVPAKTGAAWEENEHRKIMKVKGKVHGAAAVDVRGDGRCLLHILCEDGDLLLRYDKKQKKFNDTAKALGLGAKSRHAAWADLNADGRLDLASWNGKVLELWLQGKDGSFVKKAAGVDLGGECLGLSVVGVGPQRRAGLLVSRKQVPVLLASAAGGALSGRRIAPIARAGWAGGALGKARPCLVADFDGDAMPDVLQPFAKGALLYTGKQPGVFAAPRPAGGVGKKGEHHLETGVGFAAANVGDYDHNGLLDVFVVAEETCHIWHNVGKGRFVEALHHSGEIGYISKGEGRSTMTCDVNNDGRQDVFIAYSSRPPHVFFNRGYRSFGHSHSMDLEEHDLFPKLKVPGNAEGKQRENRGQQAGLVHDFDGDGAQDMVLVLADGEVWVYWREFGAAEPLGLRAVLPAKGPAGPVTVTAWSQKRCLGAWNVVAGTSEAFFGLPEQGPCKVRWQFPGGRPREKEIIVEDKPVRFVLRP